MFLIVEIVNYKGNLNNLKFKGRYFIFSCMQNVFTKPKSKKNPNC